MVKKTTTNNNPHTLPIPFESVASHGVRVGNIDLEIENLKSINPDHHLRSQLENLKDQDDENIWGSKGPSNRVSENDPEPL